MCLSPAQTLQATAKSPKHAQVRLIAESLELAPGAVLQAGLQVTLEPEWHVYWKNPGDAGLPIRLSWDLPPGFKVDSLSWPAPHKIFLPPLMNYGYQDEVVFPFAIHAPDTVGRDRVTLMGHAKWLVCKEICLPEEAELKLELAWPKGNRGTSRSPPAPSRDSHVSELLARAHDQLPLPAAGWETQAEGDDKEVRLSLRPPPGIAIPDSLWFFPEAGDWMDHAAPENQERAAGSVILHLQRFEGMGALPARLKGVITAAGPVAAGSGKNAFEIDVPIAAATVPAAKLPAEAGLVLPPSDPAGFWQLALKLALAFAGGLILNLMPCVLPVLSLKIFDFVQRAGHARLKIFAHGLTFTFGVLTSFWILAGLLLVLRRGGEELGWGYQLQSPSFLVLLCALFFFFSLNLFGVFEMGYLFTRLGQSSKSGPSGHVGSFLAGVTATVVATPCTAPFMGTAMGFAFTQSAGIALLVFTFVGLGMAAPYLLLSGFPGLMRILPKPGAWMEHLKQFMGFPLLATAIWLAWILGRQAGIDALIALLAVLLLGGISAWILGKWAALHRGTPVRILAVTVALAVFVPAFVLVLVFIQQTSAGHSSGSGSGENSSLTQSDWRPYRKNLLDSLLAVNSPVFIDFTADWCLSCKVNERIALQNEAVKRKFSELQVVTLKGDWTLSNPHITQALAGYGRQSVPLYVLYTGESPEAYQLLPEILSPNTVLEALERITPPPAQPLPTVEKSDDPRNGPPETI